MTADRIPFIDLTPLHAPLEEQAVAAFRGIYRRNEFILGDDVRRLEADFAGLMGATQGIGVSSGTSALMLILKALNVGPGDEVITTPFTFYATAAAIVFAGARPVFVDVDPGTLNLDPARLAGAATARTKAVMPVHIFGHPADMDAVETFARSRGIPVVEDACQAHGATWKGRPVGSLGAAAAFSFYPSKNLGGLGDGGMITTNDATLAERLRTLRNCGRKAQYEHVELGYNERLDNLQAALLRVKLPHLAAWTEERRRLAAIYRDLLAECPARPLDVRPGASPVYHLFTLRAPRRDALKAHLEAAGIASGIFYPLPLHLQPAFANLGGKPGDCPVAEAAAADVLSLPLFPGLSETAVRRIAAAVLSYYQ
jgi:dTDP-4-amino-4,6-dideoxygalactose transaminase